MPVNMNVPGIFIIIAILSPCVCGLQEFYRQPSNASATQGHTVVLQCVVKNKGNGAVQWTRGGFGLGVDKGLPSYPRYTMIGRSETMGTDHVEEFSLKIINLQLEDDARYQCQVMATDQHMGIVSQYAYISVLIPPSEPTLVGGVTIPVILDKPTNVTCRALNGKPKATITWKKDGIRISTDTYELATTQPDGKRIDTTGIVTLTAQLSDAGRKIECGARNEAMVAGESLWVSATLDVQYAPKLSLTSNNPAVTMREYDDIKFTCAGKANPYEITWRWYRNGELIPNENTNILSLPRISKDYHGDIIKCEAVNSVGNTSAEHSMNILYGPVFKDKAKHISVDRGERAELTCEADGNPTAEITWRRQGKHQILHSSSTYVIPNVRESMFGVYTCTATVLGFAEISREIYLTENGPPEIMSDAIQYATPEETAKIECLTISSPKPVFIWTRDGQPIDYASSGRFSAPEEWLPYGGKSMLQILNVQEEDFGAYNCTVNNLKGSKSILIQLKPKAELPMAIIIGGAVGGVAVIFIIVIACIVFHKCRHSDNESYAETDSNTEIKKRDKNDSPSEMTKSTLMDQWRQDYNYRYSAEFDEPDSKANNNGVYGGYVGDTYGTLPPTFTNGHIYADQAPDDLGPINRYENSYSTGYIPSTFRSPSRTEFVSGRVSANDFTRGTGITVNDISSGRVSATDFTSGRVSTEPLEPFRLPAADYCTTKLATNV